MTEINDLIDEGNALDANGNPEKARSDYRRYFCIASRGCRCRKSQRYSNYHIDVCLACFLPPNDSSFASSSERAIVRI